jgi:hypothetical protein
MRFFMTLPLSRPVFDANAHGGGLGDLPDWDLRDLYPATDAPEFARDMDWLEKACADFAARYEGKLASLDAAALLDCVRTYEQIDVVAGRIMSFAGLRYYQNTMDSDRAKFMADAQDRITTFTTPLSARVARAVFTSASSRPACRRMDSTGRFPSMKRSTCFSKGVSRTFFAPASMAAMTASGDMTA